MHTIGHTTIVVAASLRLVAAAAGPFGEAPQLALPPSARELVIVALRLN
jgi:hypothetical protein